MASVKKPVKVVVALSNDLLNEGICRLLSDADDIETQVLKYGSSPSHLFEKSPPDLILVDFITLFNTFYEVRDINWKGSFILIDTACGEENIVSALLRFRLAGILKGDTTPEMLKKCIRVVSKGEVWMDNKTIGDILKGLSTGGPKPYVTQKLSHREREIVSLVSQGYRNKEISAKLGISEQTVKSHLYKIFQKLNIQNRAQLIVYAMKHNLL